MKALKAKIKKSQVYDLSLIFWSTTSSYKK
jgi:hypothetical protein